MKNMVFCTLSVLLLISAECRKKDGECHNEFIIKNNSLDTVIVASKAYYGESNKCQLFGKRVPPGNEYIYESVRNCWEEKLGAEEIINMYIVSLFKFNKSGEFYDCDSLKDKNEILKHYEVSLEYLNKNNFIIVYE